MTTPLGDIEICIDGNTIKYTAQNIGVMLQREAEDNYPLEEDTRLAEPCMLSADISLEDQLFFDNLYGRFTDMEKKIFMKSFLEEGNIYEAEQEDGRILRSHKLRFPVFFNEQELYELDWDNESTVESVLLMRRAKR